jgi:hypothetical protein
MKFLGYYGTSAKTPMAWSQWMVVTLTLEEQLQLESQARSALNHSDRDAVAKLCASLIKQNAYQSQLIKQAVGYIAALETKEFLSKMNRPWWQRLFGH